jgi:hypothetical protein
VWLGNNHSIQESSFGVRANTRRWPTEAEKCCERKRIELHCDGSSDIVEIALCCLYLSVIKCECVTKC